ERLKPKLQSSTNPKIFFLGKNRGRWWGKIGDVGAESALVSPFIDGFSDKALQRVLSELSMVSAKHFLHQRPLHY
ncbi:MAG: hypothetical protein QME81_14465, partial [bacterium]|nr:hypothetical protein [bacterium]